MRKVTVVLLVFCFLLAPVLSFAQGKGDKGPSQKAMENADENAIFNRIGDWFATIGKSQEDKEEILMERKAERKAKRAKKKAKEAAQKAEKKMKGVGKALDKAE
jgi:3'-phosphoadenosine 5'-phosphosulfate sulfotransferase (PAPS reductase)/FAD synthetase